MYRTLSEKIKLYLSVGADPDWEYDATLYRTVWPDY